jgi:hypothetical protein
MKIKVKDEKNKETGEIQVEIEWDDKSKKKQIDA